MLRDATAELASPFGPLRLVATPAGLAYAGFATERPERRARWAAGRLFEATRVEALPALDAAAASR